MCVWAPVSLVSAIMVSSNKKQKTKKQTSSGICRNEDNYGKRI
jgi:hypothetical protein